jgi:hypothetical protein
VRGTAETRQREDLANLAPAAVATAQENGRLDHTIQLIRDHVFAQRTHHSAN